MDNTRADEELLRAMQANLIGHFSELHRTTTGMSVWDGRGCLAACSGLRCDTFNVIYAWETPDREALSNAMTLFRRDRLPFAVWFGPAAPPGGLAEQLDLRESELVTGMTLTRELFRPAPLPSGLIVKRVVDSAGLSHYATIVAANWTPPDPSVLQFYELTRDAILTPGCPVHLFVGYLAGRPVAAAEAFINDTAGGIYGIATLASHRRRGIGAAISSAAVDDVFRSGCSLATLQASSDGQGIYSRLGFTPAGEFRVYQ
jgi:ribosomal protein S18 acetylase RimI-like enzyme